jgi:uracil-DNA glycosylase family 4
VAWRESVALEKVARFREEPYWGRPLPGFGDPDAAIFIVGLAPAAHGGNRTGRVFTGDASGDFLWSALHRAGLADRASSRRSNDGLTLSGVRIGAAVRCAPPANKPTTTERDNCSEYLVRELRLLPGARVVVALGQFGWNAVLRAFAAQRVPIPTPRPRFGHLAEAVLGPAADGRTWRLLGSYHPSQQNTFTGKLTPAMFDAAIGRARELAAGRNGS